MQLEEELLFMLPLMIALNHLEMLVLVLLSALLELQIQAMEET